MQLLEDLPIARDINHSITCTIFPILLVFNTRKIIQIKCIYFGFGSYRKKEKKSFRKNWAILLKIDLIKLPTY